MTKAPLPGASFVTPMQGDKLFAPSAARNVGAICEVIARYAPASGDALEIASGTGQHVVAFAAACPDLRWHPTEIDPARRASIDAYVREASLTNVAPAKDLLATKLGWGQSHGPFAMAYLSNLLHLVSAEDVKSLLTETGRALSPQGVFLIYGPFKRNGQLVSEGDAEFDAKLRGADPSVGYKDVGEIRSWAKAAGIPVAEMVEMPANNLMVILRKAGG